MSNTALSKALYDFLKSENLIKKFKANCNHSSADDMISAFDWTKSKEGFDFWSEVNDRFDNYLNTAKPEQDGIGE